MRKFDLYTIQSLQIRIIRIIRYVTCSQWKGEFWIQEVISRVRLDTCLRLSTIDEVVSRRCKLRNRKAGE